MASPTRWTWVWVSSVSWWWTGKPGMLQSMRSQSRTQLSELNWTPTQFTALSKLSKIYFGYWLVFLGWYCHSKKTQGGLQFDEGFRYSDVSSHFYQCKCDGLYIFCSLDTRICSILKILVPFLFKYPFQKSECLPIVTSHNLQYLLLSQFKAVFPYQSVVKAHELSRSINSGITERMPHFIWQTKPWERSFLSGDQNVYNTRKYLYTQILESRGR